MRPDVPLFDLACARLRSLFPGSRTVADLDRRLRLAALIAASQRPCRMKACPFPVLDLEHGLCRQHLADATAQYSVSPSMRGTKMIPQPRSPQPRAHA